MSNNLRTKSEEILFKKNFTKWGLDMNPTVTIGAGLIILLFSLLHLWI